MSSGQQWCADEIAAGRMTPSGYFVEPKVRTMEEVAKTARDIQRGKRIGDWLQTFTGVEYYPLDPRVEEVNVFDIAHHTSMLCRYTGAVRRFYSVAEHMVLGSYLVPIQHAKQFLVHDGTEAYLNDINRPLKHGAGMEGYRAIEERNWLVIAERFGVPAKMAPEVKVADAHMLFHEKAALLGRSTSNVSWGMGLPQPAILRPEMIQCWAPEVAEQKWLDRLRELAK